MTMLVKTVAEVGHCSAIVKLLGNNEDIFIGHNSWTTYNCMLRMIKKYKLNYRERMNDPPENTIPGMQTAFSSYPGSVTSQDDYYLISSGLVTTETTNEIFNRTLRDNVVWESVVWENVRSMVANRLAVDGQSWSNIFKLHNSGTYNNQWMIVDYKQFKPGRPPADGTLWVVEQIPWKVVAKDLTNVFINKSYWASYNVPFYPHVFNESGYFRMQQQFGNWFSHENAPRARIFRRDHVKVRDMQSFMSLMRSNNYKKDPFAKCDCNPSHSAAGAIAARKELNPTDGSYQLPKFQGHQPSGAIDAKITNASLLLNLQFIGVSGPSTGTNGNLPTFQWSTSNLSLPHKSHPDKWNFKPVLYKWKIP